jgi:hypothetical protein
MSTATVETIYGKHLKYEIIKETHTLGSPTYRVKSSDGKFSGNFSSLGDAVQWAKEKAQQH